MMFVAGAKPDETASYCVPLPTTIEYVCVCVKVLVNCARKVEVGPTPIMPSPPPIP